jgi:Putative esterase
LPLPGAFALFALLATTAGPEFEVSYAPTVTAGPISARVYVMLGTASGGTTPKEPRLKLDWFRPPTFFAVDVHDWMPATPLRVPADALGLPGPPADLKPGNYVAQAVVRLNKDTQKIGDGEGNAYSPPVRFTVGVNANSKPVKLTIDAVVPVKKFVETDRIKLVTLDSPLLSAFHQRPVRHRAAVILPAGDPARKRATLYIIPGFGGNHFMAEEFANRRIYRFGTEMIRVVLDPDCETGHHVFADSPTNGPRGRALVEELIPHLEKTFPILPEARARLVNGHSSGGWSSLWLQINYPDTFGGVWSTSPDPVDFRDFQGVDLYADDANVFRDPSGARRPIARQGTRPVLFTEAFSKLEDVIGDGGQLHSFEAVFSPLGSDNRPRPLFDRQTGRVDPTTVKAWEAHDLRLVVERDWPRLGPKLKGKIHVVVGAVDSFYLEGAVKLWKASLEKLGSDAEIEIVPGRDHSTVLDAKLAERFERAMNAAVGAISP